MSSAMQCEVKGCNRAAMPRGKLCYRHYQRKRRGLPDWEDIPSGRCESCGTPIPTKSTAGRLSKKCASCRKEHRRQSQRQRWQRVHAQAQV